MIIDQGGRARERTRYLALHRLHGAVAAAVTRPGTNWSRLARRAGYYD